MLDFYTGLADRWYPIRNRLAVPAIAALFAMALAVALLPFEWAWAVGVLAIPVAVVSLALFGMCYMLRTDPEAKHPVGELRRLIDLTRRWYAAILVTLAILMGVLSPFFLLRNGV